MKYPQLEENMRNAKSSLDLASSENVVELCQKYLATLAKYREELYKLRGAPEINLRDSPLPAGEVENIRKEIRASVTNITTEHNRVEALLKSFTAINGFEAVNTFNSHKYKGHSNWELKAGGVRFQGGAESDRIAIYEAVETASRLRREEYTSRNKTSFQNLSI
jgi:hypothetical protein